MRAKEVGLSVLVFSYSRLFDKYTDVFSLMFSPTKVAIYMSSLDTIQMANWSKSTHLSQVIVANPASDQLYYEVSSYTATSINVVGSLSIMKL